MPDHAGIEFNLSHAGDWALVPSAYAAFAVTPELRLGIGVNAPFGLKTDYDTPWIGQYQAIHSKLGRGKLRHGGKSFFGFVDLTDASPFAPFPGHNKIVQTGDHCLHSSATNG